MKKPCKECQNEFEAKSNAQKFCSDQCKMNAAIKAGGNEVKKASEVKPPKSGELTKPINGKCLEPIEHIAYRNEKWIRDIIDYCDKNGLIPQDLIDFHKGLKKPEKKEKKTPDQPDQQTPIIAKNKQMKEPEKGTNAYFLRYGKYH